MQQKLGKWSLRFTEAPFILESSSVVGTKEADGPLGGLFDIVGKDDRFGQNTWEKAESSMQRDALTMALGKAHLDASDMDYVFAGDLLGQSMATTFGVENFRIPWFECMEHVPHAESPHLPRHLWQQGMQGMRWQ
ncbi:MAG: hypothetical protein ACLRI8_02905 [Agathobacter rectalis]